MDKKTIEYYKEKEPGFVDDKLAELLCNEDCDDLVEKYGYKFVRDKVLSKIDDDELVLYAATELGDEVIDYFSSENLLDKIWDGDIADYVWSNLYSSRHFKEMFNSFVRELDWSDVTPDNASLDGILVGIGKSFTKSYLTKDKLKEIICDYIDNRMLTLS